MYTKFLEPFEIVGFDGQAATFYAKIRAELEKTGKVIRPNDLVIAATVATNKGILISYNTQEFKQVAGLALDDWVREDEK